jgi:hypothetical protein
MPFVEFLLQARVSGLREVIESDHVIDQASDLVDEPIARFLVVIAPGASLKAADLMQRAWRAGGAGDCIERVW